MQYVSWTSFCMIIYCFAHQLAFLSSLCICMRTCVPSLVQLTNTLQKKLNEVRREKAELERQIEKEHLLKARLESRQPNDNSMAH